MPEKQSHLAGGQAAESGGTNGYDKPQDTTDPVDLLDQILAAVGEARVEPADILSAKKVQTLIDLAATCEGLAWQAMIDGLRQVIGHMPATDRNALNLYPLFDPPDQPKQIEAYLASCPPAPGSPAFLPRSLAELLALPPKTWLVQDVIGERDLVMLYGPPGSGKSFVVIDLIFACCLGQQWARRFDVSRPMQVAYCAGEGLSGLPQRFAAAAEFWGVSDLPSFTFFDAAPQLFTADNDPQVETITRFVSEWQTRQAAGSAGQLDLLVVDTLHSALSGGDENSSQDMGRVLHALRAAVKMLGCAVLLVHHTNKQGSAERGSSALRGAMDTMIAIAPTAGKFAISCEKSKDAQAWKPQTFDLTVAGESVRVWWDEAREVDTASRQQSAALLAELKSRPGAKFTAKQLSEAVAAGQSATINALTRLVNKGEVSRTLADETKPPSNRNSWVYYVVQS